MSRHQKVLFAVIMTQLASILVLLHLLVDDYQALGVAKYAVISSIFVASLFYPKITRDHKSLARAILFLFVGDFFLILIGIFPGISPEDTFVRVGGMIGFFVAYVSLIRAYTRNVSLRKKDLAATVPVLAVVVPVGFVLTPYTQGIMRVWALVFTFFLAFMAWSAICTLHRGYYRKRIAVRFAVAGYLMFLSDMGVGFSFFYPGLHRNMPWMGWEIWITYIPAWTLVLINLTEERLTTSPRAAAAPARSSSQSPTSGVRPSMKN